MIYQIQSNIPMPSKRDSGLIATVRRMKAGESLVIKSTSLSALYVMGKREGFKFATSRAANYAPIGHVRVWLKERPAA